MLSQLPSNGKYSDGKDCIHKFYEKPNDEGINE